MPRILKVELNVLSMSSSNATLEVEVTTSFYSREIASNAVFDCEVILENEDGLGDLDIRCKTIGRTWMVAGSEPVTKTLKATVDRDFLNGVHFIVQGTVVGIREGSLFLGLVAGLIGAPLRNFDLGVVVGFVVAFFLGFRGQEVEKTSYPNQGIRKSLLNSIIVGFAFGIMGGVLVGFAVPFTTNSALLLRSVIISAFAIGTIGSLVIGGGKACIQHLILRCHLSLGGNTPWNYAQFLNYAAERIFLQKVGGGYIFIHRLLLEHFATMQNK